MLPIRVECQCGEKYDSGGPIQMWLNFSNDSCADFSFTITIEYDSGKNVIQNLTVNPGEYSHKIFEPQRVLRIRVAAEGYNGLILHL